MVIDGDLNIDLKNAECDPVVFVPDVNLFELEDPSIIDSF